MSDYALNTEDTLQPTSPDRQTLGELWMLIAGEKRALSLAVVALLFNTASGLLAPVLVAHMIDESIVQKNLPELLQYAGLLLGIYAVGFVANYQQVIQMGTVGQNVLFDLRNRVFNQLQSLPLAFFQANKTGDLISRINNDTTNLSGFFSETLVRLLGSFVLMGGSALFMLFLHWELGLVALAPALVLWLFTALLSPWVRRQNARNLVQTGALSAQIQESLENFKVIVAFERRDYFRQRFEEANGRNYEAARRAGIANQVFAPIYGLMSQLAQLGVLAYGIYLMTQQQLTVGLLVAYFTYVSRFYDPLRQVALMWSSFQLSMASWERIRELLHLRSDLPLLSESDCQQGNTNTVMCFEGVDFAYAQINTSQSHKVLEDVSFCLEKGKTYAFVGPTGGGKSTTANLMTRLYDPTRGRVLFQGKDMRCVSAQERAQRIGFILQEPFLFSGSLRDNLSYGKPADYPLESALEKMELSPLLAGFDQGLDTSVENLSLGQKQLIAFMRTVIQSPDLLILDEATANIDTATESLLEQVLAALPADTTRVVIAHRLNTIENADSIFFVNGGKIQQAGDFEAAMNLLLTQSRTS